MPLLSTPLTQLAPRYDIVIIGSGYGGSITASLLSRARRADGSQPTVCLLERGREVPVGTFPDTPGQTAAQLQCDTPLGRHGPKDALYWLHAGEHIWVVQGCGLGGTSLVNANVVLPPHPSVWQDERWPPALRADVEHGIAQSMDRVRRALAATPYPHTPAKLHALRACARKLGHSRGPGGPDDRPPLAINFTPKKFNAHGIEQPACTGCGDCVSGCNVGAKNTLMMNFLPDARNHGAQIFCRVDVQRLARSGDEWVVYLQPTETDREAQGGPPMFVRAGTVMLAAGALGSSEIMLRSKREGLNCSDRVGYSFSGNGDALSFGYNTDQKIRGLGLGTSAAGSEAPPGAAITGIIDQRRGSPDDMVIEDGIIPGSITAKLPAILAGLASLTGKGRDPTLWDTIKKKVRTLSSFVPGRDHPNAMSNTMVFLVVAHDDANGRLHLDDDRVSIHWPTGPSTAHFEALEAQAKRCTEALGGTHVSNPLFSRAFDHARITVHPLGGCSMAKSAEFGVVDDCGRVFRSPRGAEVYDSLYVCDGAILPTSVGINPMLTIAALADRNGRRLIERRGWMLDETPSSGPAKYDGRSDPGAGTHFWFTERMSEPATQWHFDEGAPPSNGPAECEFVVTIRIDPLEKTLADPTTPAGFYGTATIPGLSADPMLISDGRFVLFEPQTDAPSTRRMWYRMKLNRLDGQVFYFEGHKVLRDDRGFDIWKDTTTLDVSIYRGEDTTGPRVARGAMRITPDDLLSLLQSVCAVGPDGKRARAAVRRFGTMFSRSLLEIYGPSS